MKKNIKSNIVNYSVFKRYSRFSIGGVLSPISKPTAKSLIAKFKGEVMKEYRLPAETRIIKLSNGNQILISLN